MQVYLRTHKLGMKYFGTAKDNTTRNYTINKKHGITSPWYRYLEEHGHDYKTDILFESEDQDKISAFCVGYSLANNIWNNPEYANAQMENGRVGSVINRFRSKEFQECTKGSKNGNYGKDMSGKNNPSWGCVHTLKQNEEHSEFMKQYYKSNRHHGKKRVRIDGEEYDNFTEALKYSPFAELATRKRLNDPLNTDYLWIT